MTDKWRNWSWHRQSVHLTERNGLYYQKLQLLQSSQHSSMTLKAQTLAICLHLSMMISTEDVLDEVDRYLSNADVTITCLLNYPRLAEALKYNSPLRSSAAIERLDSCTGQMLVPRRCKVSDTLFQKLFFLRFKFNHSE